MFCPSALSRLQLTHFSPIHERAARSATHRHADCYIIDEDKNPKGEVDKTMVVATATPAGLEIAIAAGTTKARQRRP